MGDNYPHGQGLGGVPAQGHMADHGEASQAAIGRELVLTSYGDGDAGSGVRSDSGVCAEEEEYGRAIHHDTTDSRTLQGDGRDSRDGGVKKVMGTGGPGPGGSKGRNGGSGRREGRGRSGERGDRLEGNNSIEQ